MERFVGLTATGEATKLQQGQDKLCPPCQKGLHEKCLKPKAGYFCCCDGEPNGQVSGEAFATKNLKATVPKGIIDYLGLKKGDTLEWRMRFGHGKRFVEVEPQRREEPSK